RPPPWPAPRARRTRPPYRPAASHLQSTEPVEAKSPDYLVDIGPAPVALEDHLARLASEHDLELPPTDGGGVPTAYRTRCRLVHEGTRKGVHFYLYPPSFLGHLLKPFSKSVAGNQPGTPGCNSNVE